MKNRNRHIYIHAENVASLFFLVCTQTVSLPECKLTSVSEHAVAELC